MLYRFAFFASFILMIYPTNDDPYITSDVFCLVNMGLFSLTNGFATSLNMALAP